MNSYACHTLLENEISGRCVHNIIQYAHICCADYYSLTALLRDHLGGTINRPMCDVSTPVLRYRLTYGGGNVS